MPDQRPESHAGLSPQTPRSPYVGPSTPPTSPPGDTAFETPELRRSLPATVELRVASLIDHKQVVLRYGLGDDEVTLLSGVLYLVEREEYEDNLCPRFLDSTAQSLDSDSPASYAASNRPWVLLHPSFGRTWVHEGWLIYDFANAGLTVGQEFIAITFDRVSFNATEGVSPIGEYTLDSTFKPYHVHSSNTILALPIFSETMTVHPANAALNNKLALAHYNTLGGRRQRRVNNYLIPVMHEYPPRPVSSQTMRYIEIIAKKLGYEANSSNASVPKRSWLKQEPLLHAVIDEPFGTLNESSQLYSLRGNQAIFRTKAWNRLCFMAEKEHDSVLQSYWQNVFEEKRVSVSIPKTKEETVAADVRMIMRQKSFATKLPGNDQGDVKRDPCTIATPEDGVDSAELEHAKSQSLGIQ